MSFSNPSSIGEDIQTAEIENLAVTTAKIADNAVTGAKTSGVLALAGTKYVPQDTTIGNYTDMVLPVVSSGYVISEVDNDQGTNVDSVFSGAGDEFGAHLVTGSSAYVGVAVKTVSAYLRKTGGDADIIKMMVRNSSDVQQGDYSDGFAHNTLTAGYTKKTFTFATAIVLASGDRLLIAYPFGYASNRLYYYYTSSDTFDSTDSQYSKWGGSSFTDSNYDMRYYVNEGLFGCLSNAEINPAFYGDNQSALYPVGFAIKKGSAMTETQIKIRGSTDATFTDAETLRTINTSDMTADVWYYVVCNIPAVAVRYFQIYGASGSSLVLDIGGFKVLTKTESELEIESGFKAISVSDATLTDAGD